MLLSEIIFDSLADNHCNRPSANHCNRPSVNHCNRPSVNHCNRKVFALCTDKPLQVMAFSLGEQIFHGQGTLYDALGVGIPGQSKRGDHREVQRFGRAGGFPEGFRFGE